MTSELTTNYLGIELQSPVIVGSCPLTIVPETVRQLVAAGAGAIVLPSILEEQIAYAAMQTEDPASAISRSGYQPQQDKYNGGVENYLGTIRELKAKEQVPIIASITGASSGNWIDYAKQIQDSGADALELNRSPTIGLPDESADQVEDQLRDMVRRLCDSVSIPVAVKLNQRFTNMASVGAQTSGCRGDWRGSVHAYAAVGRQRGSNELDHWLAAIAD